MPQAIAEIAAQNKAVVYRFLFRATADTLRTIAADPRHLGATIGFFGVLHTWGQTPRITHHTGCPGAACPPMAHDGSPVDRDSSRRSVSCLVFAGARGVAGGVTRSAALLRAHHALSVPARFAACLQPTRQTDWVVYAKRPFAGPQQVLEYVGRYTHRVAIANQRLLDIDDGHVRFHYKNYRAAPAQAPQTMTLDAPEFIRRFLLHVLPSGFHRIRYYGWLGHRQRTETLARCRQLLGTTAAPAIPDEPRPPADYRDRYATLTGVSLRRCPRCAEGQMFVVECLQPPRPHPARPDTS